jgi:hypothetical protein
MSRRAQYYRPPRRVPSSESDEYEPRSRTRDIIVLFVGLIATCLILLGASFICGQLGLYTISLGIFLLAVILIWVSVGVGIAVGVTYFVMQAFLKREFKKRFDKMDRERHDRYRRMMGLEHSDDEEKQ